MADLIQMQLRSGQQDVASAGTAEALTSTKTFARNLRVVAPSGNTGNVFVGDSGVDSTNGFVLAPGDTLPLEDMLGQPGNIVLDLNTIFVDAATNGDKVTFTYFEEV